MGKKLICAILVLTTAAGFSGCNIEIERNNSGNSKEGIIKDDGERSYYTESFETKDINKIYLDLQVANVEIYTTDNGLFKVERNCNEKIYGSITAKQEGNTIKVVEPDLKIKVNNIKDIDEVKNDIKIGIPKEYAGNIDCDYGVGKCTVSDISADKFDMECGVGDVYIDNLTFNDLSMELGVGQTKINLNKSGKMDISGGVGATEIKIKEVGGDLDFEGGVGAANIYIPENSPVRFKTETGLGACSTDVTTSGENTYVFDLSTGVGAIKVKQL